ncbi:PhoH family protein [Roseibacillus ishigakijimensis]|uniref:PhoH family protein n=1 Tax=Roseibacillus ishigakijimensis TaxID=454146 RepID=A0A934RTB5_9BACT|nr:PhoH family protein [Roseibacillus ishigakijimensis]MBK1834126.1 PhoH family protein [Roseibacillus ishigakijimensis]
MATTNGSQIPIFEEEEAPRQLPSKNLPPRLTKKKAREFGLIAPATLGKNFVLDTNVLLHDPGCLDRFADNHICLPADVLSELDRFKNEQSERGANARQVHRTLTQLFSNGQAPTTGVTTAGGGSVRLVVFDPNLCGKTTARMQQFFRVFPDRSRVDHRILGAALLVEEYNSPPVIVVTKDLNMQLKAKAVGIECEDYLNDKVDPKEVSHYDLPRIEVSPSDLQGFASTGVLYVEGAADDLAINEYVLLKAGPKQTMPARLNKEGEFVRLAIPEALRIPEGTSLKPLNLGQKCFIDALLNPDISLVTCYGQAGTGKTLVAIAAALSEVFARHYNGLTVSRPVVAMGEGIGFLPGTLDEKMRPWLQPVYDALDLLMVPPAAKGPRRKQQKGADTAEAGKKPYDKLIEQGIIEVEALCYIRGRSIPNRFFVLDEAQQLTPQEAKTIVTRMSRGSKLVLVGDPAQIDNPYVDSRSNGLVYTRKRLKGQPFVAHVSLSRGERSPLAEAGAQMM